MRRQNSARYVPCELLELRVYPSTASLGSNGFLTIMGSSPASVIHVTEYDHQMVVQVDVGTPSIFEKDQVRFLAGFTPDGEYLASLEIVFLPSVAGDVSLGSPRTPEDDAYTLFWIQHADDLVAFFSDDIPTIIVDADIPIAIDNDLISGFSASSTEEDLPVIVSEDELASVDVGAAVFEDFGPQEKIADEGFETAVIEIFSNQDDLLVDATLL